MASLRERNRLNAMRLTQHTALDMFIERGFDKVTVADIAESVGMAASTLYRHFETKEAIVLWDEHDPAITSALTSRLKHQSPYLAVRDALIETLGQRYDTDDGFQLKRVQFIYATEQVHAAAVEDDFRSRKELTAAIRRRLSRSNKPAAPLIAGAALLAVDVAIDQWQEKNGKTALSDLLISAFDRLTHLADLD